MGIVSSILGPQFLINKIDVIALILGAVLLVILSDYFNKNLVFPISDSVKKKTYENIKKTRVHKKNPLISKYLSEGIATIVFIMYCYLGAFIVAEYIFSPILLRLQNYILIAIIFLFFSVSYLINNKAARNRLMKI